MQINEKGEKMSRFFFCLSAFRTFLRRNTPIIAFIGVVFAGIALYWQIRTPQKPPTQAETKKETPEPKNEQRQALHQKSPPLTIRAQKVTIAPIKEEKPQVPVIPQPQQQPIVNSNVVTGTIYGNNNQTIINPKPLPRILNQQQKEWLTNYFKSKPKGSIQVGWTMMDSSASVLGSQLALALGESGWGHKSANVNAPQMGISLMTGDQSNNINLLYPPAASIATGLINVGLDVTIIYDKTLPPEGLFLYVGGKE